MAFAEGTTVSSEKSRLEIEALVCRYAGRWRPGEMTEEQQRAFLAEGEEFSPGRAAWAGKILDAYDLGGAL